MFLLTLAGIPPLVGFFAKLSLFSALMDAKFYVFTVIALVNTVVAAYYYLRVLVAMYMQEPVPDAPIALPLRSSLVVTALTVAILIVFVVGIFPSTTWDFASLAATSVQVTYVSRPSVTRIAKICASISALASVGAISTACRNPFGRTAPSASKSPKVTIVKPLRNEHFHDESNEDKNRFPVSEEVLNAMTNPKGLPITRGRRAWFQAA